MTDKTYDSVQMRVVRNEEQGAYQLGAVIDGVFVVFTGRKLGGVDTDLENARLAAEAAAKSPPADGPPSPPPTV
jgi:hypothetical protein